MKTRNIRERLIEKILLFCAVSSIGIVLFMVFSVAVEGFPAVIGWLANGFGMTWMPTEGQFGIVPYIFSTLYVGAGAMILSAAIGIPCAIYLAEFADPRLRNMIKPSLEMLTGLPSVVLGLFGFILIVTMIARYTGGGTGVLAAWIILAIMSLPHIASISEDAIRAVPADLREASLALGATKWQTTAKVLLPVAKSGILAALLLALGNAVGETMAVIMVIGSRLTPPISFDPIQSSNVMTSMIAGEYAEVTWGGTHWQALFGVGFILFVMVGILNILTRRIVSGKSSKRSANK